MVVFLEYQIVSYCITVTSISIFVSGQKSGKIYFPSSHMLYLICYFQNPAGALMLWCKGMPVVNRVAGIIPIIYQNTRLFGHIILNLLIIHTLNENDF